MPELIETHSFLSNSSLEMYGFIMKELYIYENKIQHIIIDDVFILESFCKQIYQ
jgi:hypothetical protein